MNKKKPAQRPKPKMKYRIENWREYHARLVERGAITIWMATDDLNAWKPSQNGKWGGQYRYSDAATGCLLTVKSVDQLRLRATAGLVRSWFAMAGIRLPIPDYTRLSRPGQTVVGALPKRASGGLPLGIDRSGLKVDGEGQGKVRQHGYRQHRPWPKFHLSIEERTLEIQEVTLTEAGTDDASQMDSLLEATTVFRFKTIFGNQLSARLLPQQRTEVRVKGAILNRMAHLGLPERHPVLA